MNKLLLNLLVDPHTKEPLDLAVFKSESEPGTGGEKVIDGILYSRNSKTVYPVTEGVPIMLKSGIPVEFFQRYGEQISGIQTLPQFSLIENNNDSWSFSTEWVHYDQSTNGRTWGWTVAERIEQLFLETQVNREWSRGKTILDAGCGNGALSRALSLLGAEVVALDFSSSVFRAERVRDSAQVSYIQADLQSPPLKSGIFDLAISIGVLHHTPNTHDSFVHVAKLVKPGGLLYLWLYRRPEEFFRRYLKYPLFDLARMVTSRFPTKLQSLAVVSYARLVKASHKLGVGREDIPFPEYLISAYDDLTPRWRHYHTPFEVSRWFYANGFSSPTLTHWDNPYGFGCVARKVKQASTPGIHYGKGAKLWDDRQTILG